MIMAMSWIVLWIVRGRLNKWLATVVLLTVVNACFDMICNHSVGVIFSTHYIFGGFYMLISHHLHYCVVVTNVGKLAQELYILLPNEKTNLFI